jgi:hypothetical protein
VKDEGDAMGEVLTEAEWVRRREHLRDSKAALALGLSLSAYTAQRDASRDGRGVLGAWTNLRPLRRRGSVRGISVYRSQLLCPFARE